MDVDKTKYQYFNTHIKIPDAEVRLTYSRRIKKVDSSRPNLVCILTFLIYSGNPTFYEKTYSGAFLGEKDRKKRDKIYNEKTERGDKNKEEERKKRTLLCVRVRCLNISEKGGVNDNERYERRS